MSADQKKAQKMEDQQEDLYTLNPQQQKVEPEKVKALMDRARHYSVLQKKMKAEPFFNRQQYYVISSKWLKRWKVYVSYDEVTGALPPSKFIGCGVMPDGNSDIVESTKVGSFDFKEDLEYLRIRLKPDLQQGKDYEFIGKEMFYSLMESDYYSMIKVARKVVETKDGKKVQLYPFNLHFILMFNEYCRDIQQERATKFMTVHFQYSLYSKVKQLTEEVSQFVKQHISSGNRYFSASKIHPIKIWILKEGLQKNIFFNLIKQGCKANNTFQYKLYIDGQLLEDDRALADYDISVISELIFQVRAEGDKNYMLFNSKYPIVGPCTNCRNTTKLLVLCSCKYAAYCSSSCKTKDKFSHRNRCPNDAQSEEQEETMKLTQYSAKGKMGLRNLGNTCFMNSGLQCISHIPELVNYFINNKYIPEINKVNKLGTKGQLSTFYAKMVQNLWFGTQSAFAPTKLKKAIGKFQPIFSGYNQHDSSQLIGYLLDGLHEDLNRVLQKPYVQLKDYDGRPDNIIAHQAWQAFLQRNKSIIVDLMYGQYKSIVDCPKCQSKSIQFDPFLLLSLPLINNNKKNLNVVFVKNHIQEISVVVSYDIKEKPDFSYVFNAIKEKLKLPADTKLIAYSASYSSCQYIKQSTTIQYAKKDNYYRTFYVRQILKGENPETDHKIFLTNKIKSTYSYYSRKSISSPKLYFFSSQLTYKQVHFKLYSYYKKFYEVANYQNDVVNVQKNVKPFRFLTIPQSRYSTCEYCLNKDCQGCQLKFNDDKFMSDVKMKQKFVQMEIEWIKNSKQITQKMQDNKISESGSSSKQGSISISDCFKLFQETQILQQDNAWYCPKCKDFVLAKKQMQIYKAPKILIVALKRFKRKEYTSQKYTIFVDYPVEGLDLTEFLLNPQLPHEWDSIIDEGQSVKYDLIGVSNHMGSTGGGHYTAYCRDITTQEWYEFDDSHVSRVKDPRDVVSSAGYVLFYKRRE